MLVKGTSAPPGPDGGILFIQLGDIGDVVLSMPHIRALRNTYPDRQLDVCVREKARELVEDCPWCDAVHSVDTGQRSWSETGRRQLAFFRRLRRRGIDTAIDIRTGTRGAVIAFLSGAGYRLGRYASDGRLWRNRLFTHLVDPDPAMERNAYVAEHGFNVMAPLHLVIEDPRPRLHVAAHRTARADRLLTESGLAAGVPAVAVHPFSLWPYKEWPPANSRELIRAITDRYPATVVLTGGPDEAAAAQALAASCSGPTVNVAGKTTIGELAAVLGRCDLFIGVDTAALHIAAAVGTPTIGLFGPTAPVSWAPRGAAHHVVTLPMACMPCRQKGCDNSGESRCLQDLRVDDFRKVLDRSLDQLLSRPRIGGSGAPGP